MTVFDVKPHRETVPETRFLAQTRKTGACEEKAVGVTGPVSPQH